MYVRGQSRLLLLRSSVNNIFLFFVVVVCVYNECIYVKQHYPYDISQPPLRFSYSVHSNHKDMPKFQVVIPAGVSPGQSFHITLSDGKVFALMCPPGHGPGQTICFEIPEAPMPIPASTKTEDSSSKIKAPPQFTTRARSLSQLYRDGEKKAWADKALVMLAEVRFIVLLSHPLTQPADAQLTRHTHTHTHTHRNLTTRN
jgi:hypothetical protein